MSDPVYKAQAYEIAKMARSINALESGNANLREESSKYYDLYVHAIADAEAWHLQWSAEHQENAKLRELVLKLYKVTQILRCYEVDDWYCQSECPLGIDKDSCTITELADRAKDLGIDVSLD